MKFMCRSYSSYRLGRIVIALTGLLAPLSISDTAWAQSEPAEMSLDGRDESAVRCLTLAIAYEAGREPLTGREAVAEVVLNRTLHPAYPKSVCGVVFQGAQRRTGCQFTFTCDGALRRRLPDSVIEEARRIALKALNGKLTAHVGGAINYHADYVMPSWASKLSRVAKIGAHIFYRLPNREFAELGRNAAGQQWQNRNDLSLAEKAINAILQDTKRITSQRTVLARSIVAFAPWGIGLSE